MKTNLIIGLGYGDEGKGRTTDYLCRQYEQTLVIRFSGGHQAGHTVVTTSGQRHVFSSVGSGALSGQPTYWSKYCTFYPTAFRNEYFALMEEQEVQAKIYIDALAPVTTPYDVYYNQQTERVNAHGSCGVGFGATIQRQESPYKLFVQDLSYPFVLEKRLEAIRQYYWSRSGEDPLTPKLEEQLQGFQKAIQQSLEIIEIVQEQSFFPALSQMGFDQLLFEGSQGILLDMDHGFFPHVTRCNTVSKNAMQLIHTYKLSPPTIYYISRAYQTRHGNGYLSNAALPLNVIPSPQETNQYNEWQGHQRLSVLDVDLLHYALQTDANYSSGVDRRLVLTCLDQVDGPIQYTANGKLKNVVHPKEIGAILGFRAQDILLSTSDCGTLKPGSDWSVLQMSCGTSALSAKFLLTISASFSSPCRSSALP